MIVKALLGVMLAISAGCSTKVSDPLPQSAQLLNAETAIARLQPGRMTRTEVESLLGLPTTLEKGRMEGSYVATYYVDLTTNYPGVIAGGKCLMTLHYSGQWAGLMFDRIEGRHYPDN